MIKIKNNALILAAGFVVGILAIVLTIAGNPGNMGFCIACFERDIAGALKLHSAGIVQYIRPEIIGIVLGATIMSLLSGEFRSKGGSAPITRFVLGFFVMTGSLVFLGCPLRMVLRLGGGDLNALIAIAGFVAGIGIGIVFLNKGFSLKRTYNMPALEGYGLTIVNFALLVLLVAAPALLAFSQEGPGSMHAPVLLSLAAGLIVGTLAHKSRICFVGGVRDAILFKDFHLLLGAVSVLVTVVLGNLIAGKFHLGFSGQPVAYSALENGDFLWIFLGMLLVGFASVLLGGCPLRQLVLAGAGNSDSAITVIGMVVGAAFCHNFGLASSTAGTTLNGRIAVILGIVITAGIGFFNSRKVD